MTATTEFISVSKVCKKQNLSVRRVLDFLANKNVIPKRSQRTHKEFTIDNGLKIISTGDSIRVIEDDLMEYLDQFGAFTHVAYVDELNELYDTIIDPKFRFERINSVITPSTKISFIDAEYKNGNYHEVAWEIQIDRKVVEKKYYLVREEFLKNLKKGKMDRYHRLKEHGVVFEIVPRKQINRIMKQMVKSIDYVVAHNAYSERQMMVKNGMWFEKSKFLCTSKMSEGYVFDRSPALSDLISHFSLGFNSHFTHYANEDATMASKVFYALIDSAVEKFDIKD